MNIIDYVFNYILNMQFLHKQINLLEKNIFDPKISCQDKDLQKAHMYWNERSE